MNFLVVVSPHQTSRRGRRASTHCGYIFRSSWKRGRPSSSIALTVSTTALSSQCCWQCTTTSTPGSPRRWSTWTGCGHSSRWHDEFNPSGQPRSPDQGQKRGADDWFVEPASPPELLGNPTGVSDPNSQIMLGPNEGTLFLKGLKDTSTLMWQISGAATSWIQVQQFQ